MKEAKKDWATICIPITLKEALQQEADWQGISLDRLVVDALTEAFVLGKQEPSDAPRKRGGHAGRKRPEVAVDMTKDLNLMDRDELKAYARAKGIRLYTVVPEKMRRQIREIEHSRAHRGDAFRDMKNRGDDNAASGVK